MTEKQEGKKDLSQSLKKLEEIARWFENQDEVDVEEGLKKVREAALLIKESKKRLKEVENEFEAIKKEISEELKEENPEEPSSEEIKEDQEEDIPF